MWYGQYPHILDLKDRFILPAKFREKINKLKNKNFYLTRGLDGCLFLFPYDVWKNLESKLESVSFTKQPARSFNRMYFSGALETRCDTQGRILIPGYLKEFAEIDREIVIVGVSDRIEIWAKRRWEKFYNDNKTKFEETAENLF